MSGNGTNAWNVSFAQISWLQRLLENHGNVENLSRSNDIIFTIVRRVQKDTLRISCLNEYTMSLSDTVRALDEFGRLDIIYVGGGWCGYSMDAKQYCLDQRIGLYVTNEMSGGLWKDEYWNQHQRDDKGNTVYDFAKG